MRSLKSNYVSICRLPPRFIRRDAAPLWLATMLFLMSPRSSHAESYLHVKYEDYREEGDRIAVKAQYLEASTDIGTSTHISIEGVYDTITGATPTGEPAPSDSDQVPLSQLEETRKGIVSSLSHEFSVGALQVEYAHSKEDDYLSNGYSASFIREINKKNTQLQAGVSFTDDSIFVPWWEASRDKDSYDLFVGVTQLINANTTITVNFTHGWSDGYMSDPYKIVQKTVEIAPGLGLALTFPENRPTDRSKNTLFINAKHFFENFRASVDGSFRLYRDNFGVTSGMLEAAWYQRLGSQLILRPYIRYYQQTAADFYHPNLDNTEIVPIDDPVGSDLYYSSDYRLAALNTTTFGLKAIYTFGERCALDLTYERYVMSGRDGGATSASAFITANTYTAGFKLWF